MHTTPLAEQPRIVIYGLRNSGKSSLMNNLFEQEISIVSEQAGTTTDPVTRSMEIRGLGAVAVTDTAGFDDIGLLGQMRIDKSRERLKNADVVLFVTPGSTALKEEEIDFLKAAGDKPVICVLTFADREGNKDKAAYLTNLTRVYVNNLTGAGIESLRKAMAALKEKIAYEISPVEGLVKEHDLVLLVTPIDLAAPKGRLILPQVETIRDLLDKDCASLIVKERELRYFYSALKVPPKLVITDSQVFSKVAADIPPDQMLTSFSILFARKKGDLSFFIEGVKKLARIKAGDRILVLESCSHHKQADDIGTVKIPRLFKQLVNPSVEFSFARSLPEDIEEYALVINCAGCMVNRNAMMSRIDELKEKGVGGLNYGLFLAWVNGLLPRALEPFPYEYALYRGDMD